MKAAKEIEKIMNPERVLTLSNIISIIRASLGLPIVILISRNYTVIATILIAVAIFSDFIDGWIARKNNEVTNLGKALDPIADKVCVFSVILYLIIKDQIPISFFLVLGARDLFVAMMQVYLMNVKGFTPSSNFTGKISILAVALVLLSYLYHVTSVQFYLMIFAYFWLAISFAHYAFEFVQNFGKRGLRNV